MANRYWKDVTGFKNIYEVSNDGKIRININGEKKIVKTYSAPKGYETVNLKGSQKKKSYLVHRLVASEFCNKKESQNIVNHIDGNKLNNNAMNLEWCQIVDNVRHAMDLGLIKIGQDKKGSKLDDEKVREIKILLSEGELLLSQIANIFEVSTSTISSIKTGHTWTHIKS